MHPQPIVDAGFEQRWAAWQTRGRAHDRLVQTRLRIAVPIVAMMTIVAAYLLAIR